LDTARKTQNTVDVGSDARKLHISEASETNEDMAPSIDKEANNKAIRQQDSFIFSAEGHEVSVGSKLQKQLKSSARTFKDIKDPSFAKSVAELSSEVDRLLAHNPSNKRLKPKTCDKEVQIDTTNHQVQTNLSAE
jgi:hypothetical protein